MSPTPIHPLDSYLLPGDVIDFDHPDVEAFVASTGWRELPEIERTRRAYEFVRDEVSHTWDVQSEKVTRRASEVLEHRVGICYAKSHLLAALLRAMGTPAGVCYQRLILFDDPEDGYALHALNAAYLAEVGRWVRFDARGNKPGVQAEFGLGEERLAFPVRPELGEEDNGDIYATPAECTVACLAPYSDMRAIYKMGLPSSLD